MPPVFALLALAALLGPAPARAQGPAAPPPSVDREIPPPSVEERFAEIQARVQARAAYPPIALARGLSGEALLGFEIDRDGRPQGVELVRSSGSVALDEAARRALADAAPLPWIHGRITLPVRFELRGPERGG